MSLRDHVPGVPGRADGVPLTREQVFSLLSNRRRRYVLYSLDREDGITTVGDLATRIGAWEAEVPPEEVDSNRRKVVYNALKQSHLPRLAERDLIEYHREERRVEVTRCGSLLTDYLRAVPDGGRRWTRVYVTVTAIACVVAVALVGDVPVVSWLPGEIWFDLLTVTLVVVTAANLIARRSIRAGQGDDPPEATDDG